MPTLLRPGAALPPPAAPAPGAWKRALARPAFRLSGALVLGLLGLVLGVALPTFFPWAEQRGGALPPDPLLALLPRHDVTVPIFVLMYGAVAVALAWLLRRPWLLLRGLWAYLLLSGLRVLTIWLVPLLPPPDLLPLPDPVAGLAMHTPAGSAITHDLFFSGHTATVVLLALLVRGRGWRWALALAATAVGVLVLVQRVHYSYDVLAAPLFAWLAYWLAGRLVARAARG